MKTLSIAVVAEKSANNESLRIDVLDDGEGGFICNFYGHDKDGVNGNEPLRELIAGRSETRKVGNTKVFLIAMP